MPSSSMNADRTIKPAVLRSWCTKKTEVIMCLKVTDKVIAIPAVKLKVK